MTGCGHAAEGSREAKVWRQAFKAELLPNPSRIIVVEVFLDLIEVAFVCVHQRQLRHSALCLREVTETEEPEFKTLALALSGSISTVQAKGRIKCWSQPC